MGRTAALPTSQPDAPDDWLAAGAAEQLIWCAPEDAGGSLNDVADRIHVAPLLRFAARAAGSRRW